MSWGWAPAGHEPKAGAPSKRRRPRHLRRGGPEGTAAASRATEGAGRNGGLQPRSGPTTPMKSATIYDVAREAGLSIKTVSRVMNHDPTVKAVNRSRVLAVAESLSYSPNLSARSLAGQKSFVIAAFLDADLTLDHWRAGGANDYLSRLQLGAVTECRAANYHFTLELIDHNPAMLRREARSVLQALKPDGVLLTAPSCDDPEMLELLEAAKVRYARLGSDSPLSGGVQLHLGDRAGGALVTRHLLELGHRRIAVITGPPSHSSSRERVEGFRDEMRRRNVPVDPAGIVSGDYTFKSGAEVTLKLLGLETPPTAIFACSDEMALGCLSALADRGVRCPDEVSVAGFDDSAGSRLGRPPLTSLRQPLVEAAARGVRMLIFADEYVADGPRTEFSCTLVRRASTAEAPQGAAAFIGSGSAGLSAAVQPRSGG